MGHFIGALLFGAIYGVASGFGVPFLTRKVLPVVFDRTGAAGGIVIGGWSISGWELPVVVIPAEHALFFTIALLPTVFAIRAFSQFANVYLLNYVGLRVLEGVRVSAFSRLQALHLAYFKRNTAGDLTSRIMVDTNHIRSVVVDTSNDLLIQPFTLFGAISYIIYASLSHPGMDRFLLSLLIVPLVVLPMRHFGKKLARRSSQMLARTGNIAAVLTENLQSPREIRAYNLEERERTRFAGMIRQLFRSQMKMVKYEKMLSPLLEFMSAASIAVAVYQASGAGVSKDDAIAIITALFFAYEPVKKLGSIYNRVKSGLAGLDRIEEILHAPVEVTDPVHPVSLPVVRGEVRFSDLTFAYEREPVLIDVNVKVNAGEIVALVGPSGAGKSTFANLVPRFYDPLQGAVLLDGVDVREISLVSLRNNIALVSQEPVLFNDTLYNNIILGRPSATSAEVERAAEQAGALEFIKASPREWETLVGERGGCLSGGQRQRIAIARAFLKNAPILILDEATSALDTESEETVRTALEQLAQGKTTFIIAHRFSTIRFATRILVFGRGRIVADGSHDSLLATCPLYRSLYLLQSTEAR
jgi:subfamily B ATP-binding cassette protein MsbA